MRCWFNRSRYVERELAGEFNRYTPPTPKPVKPEWNLPPSFKFTVSWTLFDRQTGVLMAEGHYYILDNGSTTPLDPKHLRIRDDRYAQYRGTGWWADLRREPFKKWNNRNPVKRAYARWRRFACARWGW